MGGFVFYIWLWTTLLTACASTCEKTCECYVEKQAKAGLLVAKGSGLPAMVAATNKATRQCMEQCEPENKRGCAAVDKSCCP